MKRYDLNAYCDNDASMVVKMAESPAGSWARHTDAQDEIDRLRALLLDCDAFIDRHYGGANLMKERISAALPNDQAQPRESVG